MKRHGEAPYLECSSKGDKRFSAFAARIRKYSNRSIEDLYQSFKVFEDGSTNLPWKEAKGRKAVNQAEATEYYSHLWDVYIEENPELLEELVKASGLSDIFGQPGHCCQATELWRIRGVAINNGTVKDIREYDWVAFIGTREPTDHQMSEILKRLQELDPKQHAIISGCAYGVDCYALTHAHSMGFQTIGILPWATYNKDVHSVCTHIKTIDEFNEGPHKAAYNSVFRYHPAPDNLSQGVLKLHARNYGIVAWAVKVIAAPSKKPGGGGTGQGMRIAEGLNIPLEVIEQ